MRQVVITGTVRATCRTHQMIAALIENDLRRKQRKARMDSSRNTEGAKDSIVTDGGDASVFKAIKEAAAQVDAEGEVKISDDLAAVASS